jgi:predicted RND superfamily exporter protein
MLEYSQVNVRCTKQPYQLLHQARTPRKGVASTSQHNSSQLTLGLSVQLHSILLTLTFSRIHAFLWCIDNVPLSTTHGVKWGLLGYLGLPMSETVFVVPALARGIC